MFLVTCLSTSLLTMNMTVYAQVAPANNNTLVGISEGDMLNSITMLAIGVVATTFYKYPKFTDDVYIAAAGGAAYVYAEISSTGKFKDLAKDQELQAASSGTGPQSAAQIETFKTLKKSYSDANEVLNTKKTLQLTATAAFAAATLVAYQDIAAEEAILGCIASINAVEIACPPTAATLLSAKTVAITKVKTTSITREAPGPSAAAAAVSEASRATMLASIKAYTEVAEVEAAAGGPSSCVTPVTNAITAATTSCTALTALWKKNETAGPVTSVIGSFSPLIPQLTTPALLSTKQPANNGYIEKFINFIMPQAEASSMGMMFGLAGIAAGVFSKTLSTLALTADGSVLTPKKRVVLWGMLGALSFMAVQSTQGEIDKINQNIQKIDDITKSYVHTNLFEKAINLIIPSANAEVAKAPAPPVVTKNAAAQFKMPCLTGPGDSNCPSMTAILQSSSSVGALPPAIQKIVGQIAVFADELGGSTKLSAKGMAAATYAASNHAMLMETVKKNQSPEDLQAQKDLLKTFNEQVAKTLKSQKVTPSAFLASYGGSAMLKSDASTNPAAAAVKKTGAIASVSVTAPAGAAVVAEQATAEKPVVAAAAEKTYKLNDVSTNKDESLFSIISNRYLKSAFQRIFGE
jgi:hypothetical protein